MPRKSRRRRLPDADELRWGKLDVFTQMLLGRGDISNSDGIHTENDLLACWRINRELLMDRSPPGKRPRLWWRFEASDERLRFGSQFAEEPDADYLDRHDLLSYEERVALQEQWDADRDHFNLCEQRLCTNCTLYRQWQKYEEARSANPEGLTRCGRFTGCGATCSDETCRKCNAYH